MKRFLSLFMALSMFVSIMSIQVAVSAEETEQPVELAEKVHFNWAFEDYKASHTNLPRSTTGTYGKFTSPVVGGPKVDWDGQAFYPTVGDKYFKYTPTTNISTGKVLVSVDMKLNVNSTTVAKATNWHFENPSTNKFYLLRINYPASGNGSSIYSGYGTNINKDKLFAGVPNEIHTLEILMDLDKKTQTFYVDGKLVKSYTISSAIVLATGYFRANPNIECIDNFKMIENPKNYTFSQYGKVTTEDDYVIVKFSDTVNVTPNDFVIDDGSTTVTGIEKISGRMLKLNLSNKLTAGPHNISLANANLVANVGTTAKNTSVSFDVAGATDYFDIDFENADKTVGEAYFNKYNQNGAWNVSGTAQLKRDNTYCYTGDKTEGIAVSGASGESIVEYTLTNPVTSGKLKISYDAAFNSANVADTQYMLAVNDDTDENSKILNLGTSVIGCGADMSISGGSAFEYADNVPHRFDTIIDLDSKTITNYADGTAFNTQSITATTLDSGISAVYLKMMPSMTFFDNFRMSYNEDKFGFEASDVWGKDNVVFVEFDEALSADVVFTVFGPTGVIVNPANTTKISSKRYKMEFGELEKGDYKITVPHNTKSFSGAILESNATGFYVSERGDWMEEAPELDEYAYSFAVVGDTQYINYNYPDKLHYIYDYIIDNADENKLKFVFGLGDMTDADAKYEWALAQAQIERMNTVVPYSVARGDHDTEAKFNSFFKADNYKDVIDGSYDGTMLNTYQRLYVGDINYLIFALDMGASDEVLAWVESVIEEHSDYNVIITTHAYLGNDGEPVNAENEEAPTALGYSNNGSDMWDKLIKNHSNITLVISGHIPSDRILLNQTEGVNGNTVSSILVSPEGVDAQYSGVGLVAMLYFSEDGSKVQVRYYSPIKNAYYIPENQMEFEVDVVESNSVPIAKEQMKINDISLKLNLNANSYAGKIFAVLYDAKGNIVDCKQYDAEESLSVEFDDAKSGSQIKILWWNGIETLVPMGIYKAE